MSTSSPPPPPPQDEPIQLTLALVEGTNTSQRRRHRSVTDEEKRVFLLRLVITHAIYLLIRNTPQRTPKWLEYRLHRITGSNFGAAAGHNQYTSPLKLVIEMLWKTFQGNKSTQWGSDHEAQARDEYLAWLRSQLAIIGEVDPNAAWVDETGLMVVKSWPYAGISPDGIVHVGDGTLRLLEIKCPSPFDKQGNSKTPRLYGQIPSYYYDQIQGIMGFMRMNGLILEGCDFVVWTPDKIGVQHFPYNATYFDQHLFPALQRWYNELYVPSAILYEAGELEFGESAFTTAIVCNEVSTPPPPSATDQDFFAADSDQHLLELAYDSGAFQRPAKRPRTTATAAAAADFSTAITMNEAAFSLTAFDAGEAAECAAGVNDDALALMQLLANGVP